jgi:hypothetical protein
MKTYRGNGRIAPPFLTSALDAVEWSVSRPCRFASKETDPITHRIGGGWAPEPAWTLLRREKSCIASNRTGAVQAVARRYTDSAISALIMV